MSTTSLYLPTGLRLSSSLSASYPSESTRLSSIFTHHHSRDETITFHANEEEEAPLLCDLTQPPRQVIDQIHVRIRSEQNRARDRLDRIQKLRERQRLSHERQQQQQQLKRRNTPVAVTENEQPPIFNICETKEPKLEESSSTTNKLLMQQIKTLKDQLKAKTDECNRLKDELKHVQLETRAPTAAVAADKTGTSPSSWTQQYPPLPHLAFLQSMVAHQQHHISSSTTTTTTRHQNNEMMTTTTTVTQQQQSSSSSSSQLAHPEYFAHHHYHPTSPHAWAGTLLQQRQQGAFRPDPNSLLNKASSACCGFPFQSRAYPQYPSYYAAATLPSSAVPKQSSSWSSRFAMLGHMLH